MAPLLLALAGSGCERAMHDMYQQPRYDPQVPSALFADGRSARTPPPGSVARAAGADAESSGGRLGLLAAMPPPAPALPLDPSGRPLIGAPASTAGNPYPTTLARLRRGRERYEIFCAACHGASGAGDGMVVQRGFPAPPSFHQPRLRQAGDAHLYAVISDGYGAMFPYRDRLAPADRWAIVGYLRALQLSQHARVERLPAIDRQRLQALPAPGVRR